MRFTILFFCLQKYDFLHFLIPRTFHDIIGKKTSKINQMSKKNERFYKFNDTDSNPCSHLSKVNKGALKIIKSFKKFKNIFNFWEKTIELKLKLLKTFSNK